MRSFPSNRLPARPRRCECGFMLMAAVVMLLVIAMMTTAFLLVVAAHTRVLSDEHRAAAALNLAEAGVEIALARLDHNPAYRGERHVSLGDGTIDIRVQRRGGRFVIHAWGHVAAPTREIVRHVRVTARRDLLGRLVTETWQELSR